MHPLAPDLTVLKDDELAKKYGDLSNRLSQAHRFGNGQMAFQIQMMMEDYQNEISNRRHKMMEDLLNKDDKFRGIIDIK
jgi:hypothetical protein